MAKQIGKTLQVAHPKLVPKMVPDIASKVAPKTVALDLFDIDLYTEPERPLHIDLDLDQLEDSEE